jgi:ABC-type glycerol-3-phosphate transport system permease component
MTTDRMTTVIGRDTDVAAPTQPRSRIPRPRFRPVYLLIAAWIVGVIGPYTWMGLTSITPTSELNVNSTTIFPENPSFQAYGRLLTETGFLRYMANSAIVAAGVVVVCRAITSGAGGLCSTASCS